jgi:hypothetical protein
VLLFSVEWNTVIRNKEEINLIEKTWCIQVCSSMHLSCEQNECTRYNIIISRLILTPSTSAPRRLFSRCQRRCRCGGCGKQSSGCRCCGCKNREYEYGDVNNNASHACGKSKLTRCTKQTTPSWSTRCWS